MTLASSLRMSPEVFTIGWTLIHFLWQGTALAGALALSRKVVHSAAARYRTACACLLLMLVCLPATYLYLSRHAGTDTVADAWSIAAVPADAPAAADPTSATVGRIDTMVPSIVAAWLIGVIFLSTRLLGGWSYTQYLRRRYIAPVEEPLRRRFETLALDIGITKPVWLHGSAKVTVPTVIGWLRPVVLIPIGVITGMPPSHLDAILLHELSHVRRNDYLVNLLQCVVETLLFYHPAAWWTSAIIREERENRCDDDVVSRAASPLLYAEALLSLEESRDSNMPPALAATGGHLLGRITRLLGQTGPARRRPALGAASALALVLGFLGYAHAIRAHIPEGYVPAISAPAQTNLVTIYRGDVSHVHKNRVTDNQGRRWIMVRDTDVEGALRVISHLTGITFVVPESVMHLPVTQRFREDRAPDIVAEILGRHGLWYQYESRRVIRVIVPERPATAASEPAG